MTDYAAISALHKLAHERGIAIVVILDAVSGAGADGMSIAEIMVATGRRDRNALDQLLYKMQRDGELIRPKRGIYAIGKIGKKERNEDQTLET